MTTYNKHYFSYHFITIYHVTHTSIKCAAASQMYRKGLEPSAKAQYLETLPIIGGEDPYELGIQMRNCFQPSQTLIS